MHVNAQVWEKSQQKTEYNLNGLIVVECEKSFKSAIVLYNPLFLRIILILILFSFLVPVFGSDLWLGTAISSIIFNFPLLMLNKKLQGIVEKNYYSDNSNLMYFSMIIDQYQN